MPDTPTTPESQTPERVRAAQPQGTERTRNRPVYAPASTSSRPPTPS
jgi:hypothetical protein